MRMRAKARGITLVEVLAALSLVAVAMLALMSANTIASQSSSRSYRRYTARRLAQQRLELLMMGEQKQKLSAAALSNSTFVPDTTPADCQEAFGNRLAALCDGSNPAVLGWVDAYGRPCQRTGTPAEGYHPTCQYRRYVRFQQERAPGSLGDVWRVFVAVSHARDGRCGNFQEGDFQCVVTSALLTR